MQIVIYPIIPALARCRHDDHKFKVTLDLAKKEKKNEMTITTFI